MRKFFTAILILLSISFVVIFVINVLPDDIFNKTEDQVENDKNDDNSTPEEPSNPNDSQPSEPSTPNEPEQPEEQDTIYSTAIVPMVTINSSTEVSYSIQNVLSSVTLIDIKVLDSSDNSVVKTLTTLNGSINNIDSSKTYLITGSYKGLNNTVSTLVNLSNISFSTSSYQKLSSITKEETVSNIYANSLEINTGKYAESAPEGYALKGFTLTDKNNVVKDVVYNGEEILYVEGLSANTEYLLGYYYEKEAEVSTAALLRHKLSTKKLNKYEVTPGYRIHFVGYWIISGSKEANRVRMQYKGETLYTYYLADNDSVDYINFMLPIKYENYSICGAEPYPRNVTQNMDCELVLISRKETGIYSVLFYNELGDPYHIEQVEEGKSAIGPTELPKNISTEKYDATFKGWRVDYTNITKTTHVRPEYEYVYHNNNTNVQYKAPDFRYNNIFLGNDYIYFNHTIHDSFYITSVKTDIIDSEGNVKNIGDKTSGLAEINETDIFTLKLTIKYKLPDEEEKKLYYEWKVNPEKLENSILKSESIEVDKVIQTAISFHVPYDYGKIVLYNDEGEFSRFGDLASIGGLDIENTYKFGYAIQDELNSNVYYVSENTISATTLDYESLGIISIEGEIDNLELYGIIETTFTEEVRIFMRTTAHIIEINEMQIIEIQCVPLSVMDYTKYEFFGKVNAIIDYDDVNYQIVFGPVQVIVVQELNGIYYDTIMIFNTAYGNNGKIYFYYSQPK